MLFLGGKLIHLWVACRSFLLRALHKCKKCSCFAAHNTTVFKIITIQSSKDKMEVDNMFLSLRSKKGGMKLVHLFSWPAPREENTEILTRPEPAQIINDYYCLKIGYYSDGKPIYIKPSDGKELLKMLRNEFGGE